MIQTNRKNRTTRLILSGAAALAVIIAALLTIQVTAAPPDDTRMILEHTHRTYISPPCFEQAEKTNNLAETTLKKALEHDYRPESGCTEQSLQPVQVSVFAWLMEKLGIVKGKWDW